MRHLQSQWSQGMLQNHVEQVENAELGQNHIEQVENAELRLPQLFRFHCDISCGTLLKDGRFAFVMVKEQEDLHNVIDCRMLTTPKDYGPFWKWMVELIMYKVAHGMEWLHNCNIVHRDLKASNVFFTEDESSWYCIVANLECSIGVVGTGFFRALEILQACKDKSVSRRPKFFTKKVDAYSFGMTCYEILTRKLPFEGPPLMDYDLVLEGHRLELPKYVDDWMRKLLNRCWQSHPNPRPSFHEILKVLLAN